MEARLIFILMLFLAVAIELSAAKGRGGSRGSSKSKSSRRKTSGSKGSSSKGGIKSAIKFASKSYSRSHSARYHHRRYYWRRRHFSSGYVVMRKPLDYDDDQEYDEDDDDYKVLHCYSCSGRGADQCVHSPTYDKVSCPRNYSCAVIRTEYLPLVSLKAMDEATSATTTTPSPWATRRGIVIVENPENKHMCKSLFQSEKKYQERQQLGQIAEKWITMAIEHGCARVAEETANVTISRGCRSYSSIKENLRKAPTSNTSSQADGMVTKVYSTYCDEDYCNSGDGRLKCYECQGVGQNDTCMLNPAELGLENTVTCKPNEICYIFHTVSTPDDTSDTDDSSSAGERMVTRGCSLYSSIEEKETEMFVNGAPRGTFSFSCASNLCNSIDGNLMWSEFMVNVVNSVPGTSLSVDVVVAVITMILFLRLL